MKQNIILCLGLLLGFCALGCEEESPFTTQQLPLQTYCQVNVAGKTVDLETDYLPHVVRCENGGADFEALKAQAIAARGYAYYKIQTSGSIVDSTDDQVYSCGKEPTEANLRAVKETEGQMVLYRGTTVASFFVAGSIMGGEDCMTEVEAKGTQKHVTYNWGKFMDSIKQSGIGWVNANNFANRGCKSQNGANCLSKKGWNHRDILRFFYGMDIQIHQMKGPCITTDVCTTRIAANGETIISEFDGCFARNNAKSWYQTNAGDGGYLFYTHGCSDKVYISGTWTFHFETPGTYDLYAYVEPNHGGTATSNASYTIKYSNESLVVNINQSNNTGWAHLGRYKFSGSGEESLTLTDLTGDTAQSQRVLFDAVKLVRHVAQEICDNSEDDDGNGAKDCEDSACAQHPNCKPVVVQEICDNNIDDDNNGLKDCEDEVCARHPACDNPSVQEICDNNVDDDNNGLKDCEDEACAQHSACNTPSVQEICDNDVDDDNNGLKDCEDEACTQHSACNNPSVQEICDNDVDDDNNGAKDCLDAACRAHPSCQFNREICDNDEDDDGDSYADCDDPECDIFCKPLEDNPPITPEKPDTPNKPSSNVEVAAEACSFTGFSHKSFPSVGIFVLLFYFVTRKKQRFLIIKK